MVGFDALIGRYDETLRESGIQRISQPLKERREHRRNVRALKHQVGVPIERLGADLRRLRELIRHSEHASATQQAALRQAYDRVLIETCAMLDLPHHLDLPTEGLERDIERLRVEAMLEGHGIVISNIRRHGQNA
ncbi:hypothetical protein [Microlunatus elymi]|nr:hypothetical protein [Microlunatus elymi]